MAYTIAELAEIVGARVVGDESASIGGVAALTGASRSDISHLSARSYVSQLAGTQAGAVLLRSTHVSGCPTTAVVTDNPYWAFARLSQLFEHPAWIALDSSVADSAALHATAQIGVGVTIGSQSTIGAGARLHARVAVGANCEIGEGVELHPGVVICDRVRIGAHSCVHPNAVIGAEGFGYAPDASGRLERIAQLGGVELGEAVSIGANSTIDRGALGDTLIGNGVKIDNQVQIGHNCSIGDHSVICGCCGIVGSTSIGKHCVLGGGVGVGGDGPLTICDGVTVSGMTHVSRSIEEPGVYSGGVLHARSAQWKRNAVRFGQLEALVKRVAKLERSRPGGGEED